MSRDLMSLLSRILEDYKLLREQAFCINDAWMAEAKQTKDAWVQQVIFADPRFKDIRSWECWPEVSAKLDELDEWMNSQIGSCWDSEAEAHEAIWRAFGLWVKDIEEWALANCKETGEIGAPPVSVHCGPGEQELQCTRPEYPPGIERISREPEYIGRSYVICDDGSAMWVDGDYRPGEEVTVCCRKIRGRWGARLECVPVE